MELEDRRVTSDPVFPPELETSLKVGKYTRWVTRTAFTAEQLRGVIAIVSEFDKSASPLLKLIWRHSTELRGSERAALALEALHCFARGERFAVNEWARRTHRGRVILEFLDLPDAVRSSLVAAAPLATWQLVMQIPEGYEVGGKAADGQSLFGYVSIQGVINALGPERRRGEPAAAVVLSPSFVDELTRSPSTQWAAARGFAQEHLHCLLWLAGEFGARAPAVLSFLDRYVADIHDHQSALIALGTLFRCVSMGEWIDIAELQRRIERGRAHLEFIDLPEVVQAAAARAAAKAKWDLVIALQSGFRLSGLEPTGDSVVALIAPTGDVTVSRSRAAAAP